MSSIPLSRAATLAKSAGPVDPNVVKIRDLIYKSAGIFQPDNKLPQLEDRIARRTKELKIASLREYFDCLTVRPSAQQEMVKLLNEITIGETYFFRNQPQLDALRTIVLPRVVEARSKMPLRRLKFWSAGCSTGEEPYTLAILLSEELNGLLKGWTFDIVATDLNERSLEHAKNGVYGDYAVRNLTPAIKQKYFTPKEDHLQVSSSLKSLISFSRLNLQDDARMLFMKGLDVIFCCNVLIYFDLASKRRVIQHFYSDLLSHGYLFLGHSESLYRLSACGGRNGCLVSVTPTSSPLDPLVFWEHSLSCALMCRRLAHAITFPHSERAYLAGLLHDIGVVAHLSVVPKEFGQVLEMARQQNIPLQEAEQAILGQTHEETGKVLAERWHLGTEMTTAISYHHHVDSASDHRLLTAIVSISDLLCRMNGIGYGFPENRQVDLTKEPGFACLVQECPTLTTVDWARLTFEMEGYLEEVRRLVALIYRPR